MNFEQDTSTKTADFKNWFERYFQEAVSSSEASSLSEVSNSASQYIGIKYLNYEHPTPYSVVAKDPWIENYRQALEKERLEKESATQEAPIEASQRRCKSNRRARNEKKHKFLKRH
eukprot:GHVP01069460.1.p1 GENE.GHVP01069460.1~~GHVP01069460.1.p1  ORF type:complete len:116 (-),score=8.07 GHVP01069460.1:877-1224(-)